MANPTTNYSFAMPTNTDLVKDLPADFEVFGQAVDTQMKTNADAAVVKSTFTTKGDIIAATAASTPARLAVGANDTVLTADSTAASGVKWAAIASGGLTLLSTTNLSGTSTTISSINQTYTHLLIIVQNPYTNVAAQMRINPNGSGSACATSYLNGSTAGAGANLATIQNIPTATGSASYYCLISNYSNSTYTKPVTFYGSATTAGSQSIMSAGICVLTNAITDFDVTTIAGTSTFSGGRVLTYGVK